MQQRFTFCICPDGMLLQDYLDEVTAVPANTGEWKKSIYWGDEELPKNFWDHLILRDLFTTKHILIVRNAQHISAEIWKNLSSILGKPNQFVWNLFCLENTWEKKQPKIPAYIQKLPCFTFAKKHNWIWSSPGLTDQTIKQFLQSQSERMGLTFSDGLLEIFTTFLPPNAALIKSELSKLALYVSEDTVITHEHIATIGYTTPFDIFSFLRHVQSNNFSQIWKSILREHRKGEEPLFLILAMLQREAKLFWQIFMGEQVKLYPNEVTKKKQLVKRIGITGIVKLWDALYLAEFTVKSGQRSPSQSLETLIATLLPIFR